ncbi:hypothetical protein D9X91_10885 [Falsibacillus albus]|uniref:Uncharacterized protein n=1 Tax=Falsibacillus albus TaxID=2478915 RepID=A0A3L7JXK5_9BACI|nr:hypothetical protein D9X91_10885 [Falsibacillus albus]
MRVHVRKLKNIRFYQAVKQYELVSTSSFFMLFDILLLDLLLSLFISSNTSYKFSHIFEAGFLVFSILYVFVYFIFRNHGSSRQN